MVYEKFRDENVSRKLSYCDRCVAIRGMDYLQTVRINSNIFDIFHCSTNDKHVHVYRRDEEAI